MAGQKALTTVVKWVESKADWWVGRRVELKAATMADWMVGTKADYLVRM